jgi:hypothetical protein
MPRRYLVGNGDAPSADDGDHARSYHGNARSKDNPDARSSYLIARLCARCNFFGPPVGVGRGNLNALPSLNAGRVFHIYFYALIQTNRTPFRRRG